ncbi:MAG TPA: hypothetical protein VJ508_02760, partial [Saprospiraceae bacterium]|nr:hypothetical protein [Saprospiraceae bacterium]
LLIIDDQYRFDHGSIHTYGRKVIHITHIKRQSALASVNSCKIKQKSFQCGSIQKLAIFNDVVVSPERESGLLQTLFSYSEVISPTLVMTLFSFTAYALDFFKRTRVSDG